MQKALLLCVLFFSLLVIAKDSRIVGYVHDSRNGEVELDGIHVTCSAQTEVMPTPGFESGRAPADCSGIRIGDHVQISGEYRGSRELRAKKVFVDPIKLDESIRGFALMERAPELVKGPDGWSGKLKIEGRTLAVSPKTTISFADSASSKTGSQGIQSLDQVGTNVYVAYEARPEYDGTLAAIALHFVPNETSPEELKFRQAEEPQITEPDYVAGKAGKIRFGKKYDFDLSPDRPMQVRVTKIGESLIPEFQRNMTASDPAKLKFQFFVVETKKPMQGASANGMVLISEDIVQKMKNDAQLAALLSFSVAQVIQEQEFRANDRKELQRFIGWSSMGASFVTPVGAIAGFVNSGTYARFQRLQAEQALRVGMDYMERAGFDIREVPQAWVEETGKAISDSKNTYARYVFEEIRRYHSGDDFDKMKANLSNSETNPSSTN